MSDPTREIINFVCQLLVALLVWNYFKKRNYSLDQKYHTFWPRFWTGSVDACVMWPISFAALLLLGLKLPSAVGVAALIVQNLAWLLYAVTMHTKHGQTYGKMACNVRVVDYRTEGPISFRQACLREGIPIAVSLILVGYEVYAIITGTLSPGAIARGEVVKNPGFWLLASLPTLWFVAEAFTMLTNEKRRALHDYIAGTVVVRTNVL